MPSHVPRFLAPVKQLETLAKREARLKYALTSQDDLKVVNAAAEEVRSSQLSVLKARRELIRYKPETAEKASQLESICRDEEFWRNLPVQEIIKKYDS